MQFEVYFEIYGKKMKVTIEDENEQYAEYQVRSAIIFHKVKRIHTDPAVDQLKKMFGIFD